MKNTDVGGEGEERKEQNHVNWMYTVLVEFLFSMNRGLQCILMNFTVFQKYFVNFTFLLGIYVLIILIRIWNILFTETKHQPIVRIHMQQLSAICDISFFTYLFKSKYLLLI